MKPPDEKTIEELNAAERGKAPRSKWRIVVAVLVGIALVLGGSLIGVETYRHSKISSARTELDSEAARVAKRYEHVTDWRQWYIDRQPPGTDYDGLHQWIDAVNESGLRESKAAEWARDWDSSLTVHYGSGGPPPTNADLQRFLELSLPLARQAHGLLEHDHISLVPEIVDGTPDIRVIPTVEAFLMLQSRITTLRVLNQHEQAWRETTRALQLAQRWDSHCALIDAFLAFGVEQLFHSTMAAMMPDHPPDAATLEVLRAQPQLPASLDRELIECELAFFTQAFATLTPEEREDWLLFEGEYRHGWFNYLAPDLSWRERKHAFAGEAEMTRATADYLHQVLYVLENPTGGVTNLNPANPLTASLISLSGHKAEVVLLRQKTAAIAEVAIAMSEGTLPATVRRVHQTLLDLEVVVTDSDVTIRARYSDSLRQRLAQEFTGSSEEEFYEWLEPVTLPLPK